jgi:4-amino-4-deoxy-L-arabinose transferase-like glycosyltransferase
MAAVASVTSAPEARQLRRPSVAARALLVAAGALLGGVFGAVITVVAVRAARRYGTAALARAAVAVLVLAGVLTALERRPSLDSFGIDFATDRPLATGFAQVAMLLTAVVIVFRSRDEAVTTPAPLPASPPRGSGRASVSAGLAVAVAAAAAIVPRAVLAPPALPPDYVPVVRNLAAGLGLRDVYQQTSVLHPPLAALVGAFFPGRPAHALFLASMVTVVACTLLAFWLAGRRAALVAGLLAALLPSFWGQQLPEALAAAGVASAFAFAVPVRASGRRMAVAGVGLGLASLARPEVVLLVPIAAAWVLVGRRASVRRPRALAITLVAAAFAVLLPWQLWAHHETGGWLPSTNLGQTLAGATTPRTQHGRLVGAFDLGSLFERTPGADEHERDLAFRRRALADLEPARVPALVGARVARGWDLWAPGDAGAARDERGLTLPAGSAGVAAEAAASLLAVAGLVALRRWWRDLFPLFAGPVLFTIVTALTYGDRGLRAWAAPFVAVTIAVVVTSRRPAHRAAQGAVWPD